MASLRYSAAEESEDTLNASHSLTRSAVAGRRDESGDQYDGSGQRQHVAGITRPKRAAVLHPDHAVHWTSIGSYRQCNTRLENGSVVSPEEQREAVGDDAGRGVVSVGHERRGEEPGEDGTKDQGV